MDLRERQVFTFDPREWTRNLVEAFFEETKIQCDQLFLQIQKHVLSNDKTISEEEALVKISKAVNKLKQYIFIRMKEQTDIFQNYVSRYVFKVPCDAIIAVTSEQVPIIFDNNTGTKANGLSGQNTFQNGIFPPSYDSNALFNPRLDNPDTSTVLDASKMETENESSANKMNHIEDIPDVSTQDLNQLTQQLQKAEYFTAQLTKVVQVHSAYIERLEKILFCLDGLDEAIQTNDVSHVLQVLIEQSQETRLNLEKTQTRIEMYRPPHKNSN